MVYLRVMALNIKSVEVERLVDEVSRQTGESKTEAVRRALLERRQRLAHRIDASDRRLRARRFLEREVWPRVPDHERGRRVTSPATNRRSASMRKLSSRQARLRLWPRLRVRSCDSCSGDVCSDP